MTFIVLEEVISGGIHLIKFSPCEMVVPVPSTVKGYVPNLIGGDDWSARAIFIGQIEAYNVILDSVEYPPGLHLQYQMGGQISHVCCVASASPVQMSWLIFTIVGE